MVSPEEQTVTSEKASADTPPFGVLPEDSGASAEPAPMQMASTIGTRPKKVRSEYPMRTEVYYHVTNSELRNSRVAQALTAVFAAIGALLFSLYWDYQKDLKLAANLAAESEQIVHPFVENAMSLLFWGSWLFWVLALAAWVLQGSEIRYIKEQHKVYTWWRSLWIIHVVRKIPKP